MKATYFLAIALLTNACCAKIQSKSPIMPKNDPKSKSATFHNTTILHGEIVAKLFMDPLSGKVAIPEKEEYYLRCSVQDYFIKFCESEVSQAQISTYYNPKKITNPISVEAEIKNGDLDTCENIPSIGRIEYYVAIKSILP